MFSTLFFPDRKSTRLNSSHLVISYAVFCLKKNKIFRFPRLSCSLVSGCLCARCCSLGERPGWPCRCVPGAASGGASVFFFFNDTATTEIYTLSLHDALPI